MNSFTPAAPGRVGAGFRDIKAGGGVIARRVFSHSLLVLLLMAAPQAMAANFPDKWTDVNLALIVWI